MEDKIIELKTLKKVQEWVFEMLKKDSAFIYRGQGDNKWELESTFVRNEIDEKNNKNFIILKKYFIEQNKFLKDKLVDKKDDLSLLGKMQHFGNDTPLIDFTEDILVSLWFGASYLPKNTSEITPPYFRIFYLEIEEEHYANINIIIDKITFDKITYFKFKTDQKFGRAIGQKSVFIFDNLNLKEIKSVLIKNSLQISIIKWLGKKGINLTSLFPDDEGEFRSFNFLSYRKFFFDGNRLLNKGKYEDAIKKYKKAIEINSNNVSSYNNWGLALKRMEKYKEAIQKFKKAIKINPKYNLAYYNWGIVLDQMGKYEEAIQKFKKAIEIDPNDYSSYGNWGIILDKMEKYEDAIEKYKKVIKINTNDDLAYLNLGIVLAKIGNHEEAIQKFKKAIEINPNNDSAYYNWGIVLDQMGKYEEAIQKFKKAIEINPNNDSAIEMINSLKEKLKNKK